MARRARGQTVGEIAGLIGREAEKALILDRLRGALAGTGCAVIVEGEAGIGKTRLVQEAFSDLTNATFFSAAGDEMERERPFGLIAEAFGFSRHSPDEVRRRIGRLLRGEERPEAGDPQGLRFHLVDEIVDQIERMASVAPLVLVLEDIHWADAGTVATMRTLGRLLAHIPLLLVATLRPAPRGPDLDVLLRALADSGATDIALAPLNEEAVNDLTSHLVKASPDASLMKVLARAGGNPFFVTEIVAALDRAGAIVVDEGTARSTGADMPTDLSHAVLRRLSAVSERAAKMLQLASVLGSTFAASDVVTVARIEATDAADHITEGMRCGVLDEAGDRLGFRHDVVREAIYLAIPISIRKALHMQAARAFAAAGAPIEKIAAHVSIGAEVGDEQAVEWLREAARSPLLAPGVAVELLQRAAAIAPPDEPLREMLATELIVMLSWAGRRAEAKEMADELLRVTKDPVVTARARLAVAQILLLDARYEEAIDVLESALVHTSEPNAQATLLASLAASKSITPLADSDDIARRAIETARSAGNETALAVGFAALSQDAWKNGDVAKVRKLWEEARRERPGGVLTGEWALGSVVVPSTGVHLAEADLTAECEQELAIARQDVERLGTAWSHYYSLVAFVRHWFLIGEWDDAATEAESGIAFADENGIRYGWLVLRPALGAIAVHRGDVATAEAVLPTEAELHDRGANVFRGLAMLVWALVREARGRLDEAADLAARAEAMSGGGNFLVYPPIASEYVRLCLATGRVKDARRCLETLERVSAHINIPSARGFALRARGLLDEDPDLLRRAVQEFRRSPRVPELAAACEDAGMATASTPEGLALVEESLAIFDRLGATRDVARVEARLRAAGVRRGVRGRRSRPSTGWESMTPTELRIVSLVADGLSNPEVAARLFISRNTVQTHLAHIFQKLGISSRLELAVQASRHTS